MNGEKRLVLGESLGDVEIGDKLKIFFEGSKLVELVDHIDEEYVCTIRRNVEYNNIIELVKRNKSDGYSSELGHEYFSTCIRGTNRYVEFDKKLSKVGL